MKQYEIIERVMGQKTVSVKKLAGDASTRQYYRCLGTDHSLILQVNPDPFEQDSFAFLVLQKFFALNQLPVPQVHAVFENEGLVFLEDLGDHTLQSELEGRVDDGSQVLVYYQRALDIVFQLHSLSTLVPQCHPPFDLEKYTFEMNFNQTHLYKGLLQSQSLGQRFVDLMSPINSVLQHRSKFLCHRDFHSRNLMLHHGQLKIIDFQDARLGALSYDIVSLAFDPYVVLRWEQRLELIKRFRSKLDPQLRQDFDDECFLVILQRLFKACGSFASLQQLQQKNDYLLWIRPSLTFCLQLCHDSSTPMYQGVGSQKKNSFSSLIQETLDQLSYRLHL